MPDKLTAAQAKQFWTEETHRALCDAIEASLADTTTYVRGVNSAVFSDTVRRLQRLGKDVTADDVKKHYETYRRKVSEGQTTLWGVAFVELLPVSPQQTAKKWEPAEHQRFLELLKQHGHNFQLIAVGLPCRNENAVQNHYYTGLKKALDEGKTDYCGCP